jgi:hypothetical protein
MRLLGTTHLLLVPDEPGCPAPAYHPRETPEQEAKEELEGGNLLLRKLTVLEIVLILAFLAMAYLQWRTSQLFTLH